MKFEKSILNAKNSFKAIDEHAVSVINYHIGVLKLVREKHVNLMNPSRNYRWNINLPTTSLLIKKGFIFEES